MKTSSEICSPMRQRVAQRLGDEQRGHRQVDRGAVEVERVAGRHDDADGRLVDADVLHLGDQPRQRGLRGRGRQDQQELAAEVLAAALKMLTPGDQLEHGAEDDEDEERAGDVEARPSARARLFSASDAGLADDRGHRAERADRGGPHDHRQHPEDQRAGGARRRAGSARRRGPSPAAAKPTSSATSRVCSTSPDGQRGEQRVGMMPSRKSVVLPCPRRPAAAPALGDVGGRGAAPSPGGSGCRRPGRWPARPST